MAKVTISEAVGLTGISESTIRRDIKSGKSFHQRKMRKDTGVLT